MKNDAQNNFIDVAKKSADGKPIEQFLVSYYDSKGTFDTDKGNFSKLAERSNKNLEKIIPNYQTCPQAKQKSQRFAGTKSSFKAAQNENPPGERTVIGQKHLDSANRPKQKKGCRTMLAIRFDGNK